MNEIFIEVIKGGILEDKLNLRQKLTVGRFSPGGIDNFHTINHMSVSRLHAEIFMDGDGQCKLVDMGSTHGTCVNKVLVKQSFLHDGDVLQFGNYTAMYMVTAAEEDGSSEEQSDEEEKPKMPMKDAKSDKLAYI
jgi:pSer/pThr/pTyr-binding forkhead associated (FHA) protein